MAKRHDVAIWLQDDWGRSVVDAKPGARPSRWVIQGVIVEEVGAGVWVSGDTIKEFRPLDDGSVKHVSWVFKSSQLLIPWSAILTIQAFDGGAKEFGFKAE